MTVSLHHPIKGTSLSEYVKLCIGDQNVRFGLYFVVPPDVFDEFRSQSYINQDDNGMQKFPQILKQVDQYVLEMPFL